MKAVNTPIIAIKNNAFSEYSNKGEHLNKTNTPAVTMVAACIKADTGVGPSIASGNQVCKPICADLPMAPINNNKLINVILLQEKPKKKVVSSKI